MSKHGVPMNPGQAKKQVAHITITPSSATLDVGTSIVLTAVAVDSKGNIVNTTINWSSSNVAVATISNGVIVGVSAGSATIVASVANIKALATIAVNAAVVVPPPPTPVPVASVVIPSITNLAVGVTTTLSVSVLDANGNVIAGRPITWQSDAPLVVAVSDSGAVTALSAGTATIAATCDGVTGFGTVAVSAPVPTPDPTPTPTPTPDPTGYVTVAESNFDNGTIDPFFNYYASTLVGAQDIIDDPTGAGRGKVMRIKYANAPSAGWYDMNDAVSIPNEMTEGYLYLGQEILFTGDVYYDNTTPNVMMHALRKLLYWGVGGAGWDFPHRAAFVLCTQPMTEEVQQVFLTSSVENKGTIPEDYTYTGVPMANNMWHKVEIQLKLNTAFATKDGILRMKLNDVLIYDRTDMAWTDPAWTEDPSTYFWYGFRVGEQLNSSEQVSEDRYWDNLKFQIKR